MMRVIMPLAALEEMFKRVIAETATTVDALGFRRRDNLLGIMAQGNSGLIVFQRGTKNSKERLLYRSSVPDKETTLLGSV